MIYAPDGGWSGERPRSAACPAAAGGPRGSGRKSASRRPGRSRASCRPHGSWRASRVTSTPRPRSSSWVAMSRTATTAHRETVRPVSSARRARPARSGTARRRTPYPPRIRGRWPGRWRRGRTPPNADSPPGGTGPRLARISMSLSAGLHALTLEHAVEHAGATTSRRGPTPRSAGDAHRAVPGGVDHPPPGLAGVSAGRPS